MTNHDLRLPEWGPYTKKYMGISHVADAERGWRFDLGVAPGLYRRKVDLPNVLWESGYHPWEASPDLAYFCHRHELEWRDQVYCDIAFAAVDESARLLRCECVNQTGTAQGLALHLLGSLQFPKGRRSVATLPLDALWIAALDYAAFEFGGYWYSDGLATDLMLRGEKRGEDFVTGSGLAFHRSPGDHASYQFNTAYPLSDAALLVRYRATSGTVIRLQMDGATPRELELPGGEDGFSATVAVLGPLDAGRHTLELVSCSGAPVELDGFVLLEASQVAEVQFHPEERNPRPELIPGPSPASLLLKYPGLDHYYGIVWDFENFRVREFLTDDLDILMRYRVHDHVSKIFYGSGEGHYTDAYLQPIPLPPHSKRVLYGMVCSGSREEVAQRLAAFDFSSDACEAVVNAGRAKAIQPRGTPAGRAYEFSQARMSATTLTNVVYPAYARRAFIKHSTPGRWWDSLYTWDSGFIGLGLLEMDHTRAIDCLKAYLTEPGDPHAAFALHGSPVPVQLYLFQQLWNRTQSRELLEYLYPRLRQYHHFLSGRDPRSCTRGLKSNLLQTWHYFYNSGGWDDYPPQQHLHDCNLTSSTATVVNTAHCIRTAKILRLAARELGLEADISQYDEDIAVFTEAIQTHAWDESSGYFGYVRHTPEGLPEGILRHESGANFNMGLDGVTPLVAGICTPEQKRRLVAHLSSDQELWTPIGLSTVDQSAPYYRIDGYWNGAVWMPHQWFIWKTLLDLGESDLAFRIAQTALQLWASEVGTSYNCCEHFTVKTGRGAGWHHFGGLSTPVLCWFAAYYVPGNLNGGLDVWVSAQEFSNDNTALRASLAFDTAPSSSVSLVAVMNPGHRYRALWEGREIELRERSPGTLDLVFTPGVIKGRLEIVCVDP